MDIQAALASLLRPMPAHGISAFHPLLTLTSLDQSLLGQYSDQALSPKKARIEDSSSPLSSSTVSSSQLSTSPISSPRRKLPQPIPDEKKDGAYFERRRKNNDAAKRSRDLRRQKEEATMRRAAHLEQENAQLKGQLALMKSEMANIQLMLLGRAMSSPASQQASQKERVHWQPMVEKFEEKLLKMYKSALMGADITMTIRLKKEEKTISNRKESEEQLDWQKPLPTMILPEKDYLTFDDMELEARRIMKAAETKGIPLEREIAERNRKSLSPVSSSIYEMYFPDSGKSIHSSVFLNSEDTSTNSRPKTKKKRTRDRSSDLRLVNTEGQTASFFDIDSLSVKTDEMFP